MKEKVLAYGSPIPEDYRHVLVPGLGYDYVCAKCGDFGTPAELYGLRCKKVYALLRKTRRVVRAIAYRISQGIQRCALMEMQRYSELERRVLMVEKDEVTASDDAEFADKANPAQVQPGHSQSTIDETSRVIPGDPKDPRVSIISGTPRKRPAW
ncbi:MAG: hypothetical protein A2751_02915 [Candidatus Doudnabacteria bacterium RIFCSPHIGHO2_01_FULL_46_14]|uniref:Uncharacterized protein n=1 Tax=Candidatus Doudnabacteria bacterium RIFCSPHIGHO2_01_FULL_46_14 TaxID=1817824 RepID=A0A1F5NJU0_9BACT|nr:MAG: hypothetical protein A2751_02915 [Candidatus Doudnabacteria bacterium RIFCSPHIGHO2_01_FULL_46_14]